jgi:hypothetical protein
MINCGQHTRRSKASRSFILRVHLLRIELRQQPRTYPFNFEAVFKTIKGYYQSKEMLFEPDEYMSAGPLLFTVLIVLGIWDF